LQRVEDSTLLVGTHQLHLQHEFQQKRCPLDNNQVSANRSLRSRCKGQEGRPLIHSGASSDFGFPR
jgi:hypothetical protein